MNYIIDIVFIALCAMITIRAAKRGFVLSALEFGFSLVGTAVSWVLSASLCEDVYTRLIREKMMTYLNDKLLPSLQAASTTDIQSVLNAIPKPLISAAEHLGIFSSDNLTSSLSGLLTAEKLESVLLGPVAIFFAKTILFVCFSLLIGIILRFAAHAISRLVKASPLKSVNALLGALFGLLKGSLIVLVFSLALTAFSYAIPESSFSDFISQSKICGFAVDILTLI